MLAFPLISYTSIPIEARLSDVFVTATGTLVAMLAIATDAKFLFGNKIGNEIDAYPDESVSLFPHCTATVGNKRNTVRKYCGSKISDFISIGMLSYSRKWTR